MTMPKFTFDPGVDEGVVYVAKKEQADAALTAMQAEQAKKIKSDLEVIEEALNLAYPREFWMHMGLDYTGRFGIDPCKGLMLTFHRNYNRVQRNFAELIYPVNGGSTYTAPFTIVERVTVAILKHFNLTDWSAVKLLVQSAEACDALEVVWKEFNQAAPIYVTNLVDSMDVQIQMPKAHGIIKGLVDPEY